MTTTSVAPRKEAKQERSRLRVEKILSTALEMLAQEPGHKVSTAAIAKRAGVSVGTLYQFFPNKEAVLYELYQRWLNGVLEALDRLNEDLAPDATRGECVDAFLVALTEPGVNSIQNWKLRAAMTNSADLIELEARHQREVLTRVAKLQKRFGAPGPAEMSGDLMLLQNELSIGCLHALALTEDSPHRPQLLALAKNLLLTIFDYPTWSGLGEGADRPT